MLRSNEMDANSEAIKNLIEPSAKVLIAAEPSSTEAIIFSTLALKRILQDAGKNVFLHPKPPEKFAMKFGKILPKDNEYELPQKIKIKIPKSVPIDEIQYEDTDGFLNILILPKNQVNPQDLLIERSPYEMDAAFCFFDDNPTTGQDIKWEKIAANVEKPPREKTVYFTSNKKSLAEKVNEIYEVLGSNAMSMPMETATLLFASLVYETENFTKRQTGAAFGLAKCLLDYGADKKALADILIEEKKPGTIQLFGRALARTTSEKETRTNWTFLTRNDFTKTGLETTKENLLFILRKIRSETSRYECSVICYETAGGIGALICHENKNVLDTLSPASGTAPEGQYLFFPGFKNFSEAENKIRSLLKQNISSKMKE